MRVKMLLLLVGVTSFAGLAERSEACWRRRQRCCCNYPVFVSAAPQAAPKQPRVRTYLEGDVADDDRENVRKRPPGERRTFKLTPADAVIPPEDIFEGEHRKTPKTTVVHDGESRNFDTVDDLIAFFESPARQQDQYWGTVITKTTDERNPQIELVNATVRDAWIYEISHQADNDYHLLIGVNPDNDQGRYMNAEISALNPDSPDAKDLWQLRKLFKQQYENHTGKSLPKGYTQPRNPIHITLTGSIFLDADHDRRAVGHGDIKNFTSWEIHPITMIQILED
jgi:hypothetical protein